MTLYMDNHWMTPYMSNHWMTPYMDNHWMIPYKVDILMRIWGWGKSFKKSSYPKPLKYLKI